VSAGSDWVFARARGLTLAPKSDEPLVQAVYFYVDEQDELHFFERIPRNLVGALREDGRKGAPQGSRSLRDVMGVGAPATRMVMRFFGELPDRVPQPLLFPPRAARQRHAAFFAASLPVPSHSWHSATMRSPWMVAGT
jgi:hypothetical protein